MGNIFTIILVQPLTNGLILFYRVLGQNLGVAILVFSLFLIFLLRPLTKPYMQSMKKIRDLEPQLAKLRQKFGKDKMKMSQAQAELYKQNKINPAAGCLPYILQFLVLIALFQVFTAALSGPDIASGKLNQLLYQPLKFAEGQRINTKFLYLDTSKPDTFNVSGIPFGLPGLFLILATLAQFLSVKIMAPYLSEEQKIAKKTKSQADDMQVAMQSSMTYTLPLMTLIFGLRFPSGLALYWLVFSIVNVWQQVRMSGWGSLTPSINLLKSKLARK
ncbi:MAG TPA: YidC/Oxa1 family membrane protein insertase [Candidatus Saccharimonadales bacterium]|jgi:YidC/Oxa1 family membrane protein insertase|nr:YidC/Oxa1 family membrane protein insertase [Candidatus Saccharimonadales bacterium]